MTLNEQESNLVIGFAQNKLVFDLVKQVILSQGEVNLTFLQSALSNTDQNLGAVVRARTEANVMVERAFSFMANLDSKKVVEEEINEAR